MRGFSWVHILFAVPALALAFGIQHYLRSRHPQGGAIEQALVKPSFFKADGSGTGSAAQRTVAASAEARKAEPAKAADQPVVTAGARATQKLAKLADKLASETHPALLEEDGMDESEGPAAASAAATKDSARDSAARPATEGAPVKPAPSVDLSATRAARAIAQQMEAKSEAKNEPKTLNLTVPKTSDDDGMLGQNSGASCMSVEYRGDGPAAAISPKDWENVLTQFSEVKKALLDWLDANRKGFSEKMGLLMESQIRSVKLQKPPVTDEPDLNWRGIGVYVTDSKSPMIRVSPGFVKLVNKQPVRAKFELARLVAQGWAPCELQKQDAGEAWGPLLKCLQITEAQACAAGSYSEAGWAVSSTLAAVVAPPGCALPAFKAPELAQCLKRVPTPLLMTAEAPAASEWKEARR